jgi:hypothetical protein
MYKRLLLIVCVVAIGMLPISSGFSAMNGLVGAWLFDDGDGNKVTDSSGNGHDGELIGNAKLDKNGKWHHIVCMKAGNKVKVYIDGKEDGSTTWKVNPFTPQKVSCWH